MGNTNNTTVPVTPQALHVETSNTSPQQIFCAHFITEESIYFLHRVQEQNANQYFIFYELNSSLLRNGQTSGQRPVLAMQLPNNPDHISVYPIQIIHGGKYNLMLIEKQFFQSKISCILLCLINVQDSKFFVLRMWSNLKRDYVQPFLSVKAHESATSRTQIHYSMKHHFQMHMTSNGIYIIRLRNKPETAKQKKVSKFKSTIFDFTKRSLLGSSSPVSDPETEMVDQILQTNKTSNKTLLIPLSTQPFEIIVECLPFENFEEGLDIWSQLEQTQLQYQQQQQQQADEEEVSMTPLRPIATIANFLSKKLFHNDSSQAKWNYKPLNQNYTIENILLCSEWISLDQLMLVIYFDIRFFDNTTEDHYTQHVLKMYCLNVKSGQIEEQCFENVLQPQIISLENCRYDARRNGLWINAIAINQETQNHMIHLFFYDFAAHSFNSHCMTISPPFVTPTNGINKEVAQYSVMMYLNSQILNPQLCIVPYFQRRNIFPLHRLNVDEDLAQQLESATSPTSESSSPEEDDKRVILWHQLVLDSFNLRFKWKYDAFIDVEIVCCV